MTVIDTWKDRKIGSGYEKAGDLVKKYSRLNYRLHPDQQKAATEGSLDLLGWVGEVKLAVGSDKTLEDVGKVDLLNDSVIFDGHLRVELALLRFGPDALVPVNYYNLNRDEANQALLLHDTTTGMAETDWATLDNLLKTTPPIEIPEFQEWMQGFLEQGANGILDEAGEVSAPEGFNEYGEGIETEYCCPKCGYEWSGSPK